MKYPVLILFAVFSFELDAQTSLYNHFQFMLQPLKIKTSADKQYTSLFNTGIEYGKMINLTEEQSDYLHAYWIFFDFNIWNKILYTRLDLGGISDRKLHGGAAFVSLGLNSRFFGYGRHNFYLYAGFKGLSGNYYAAVAFVVNPKYVFSLSKLIGVSGGLRYMLQIGFPQRFLIYSVGIQFSPM